jgi:hypothetical protein
MSGLVFEKASKTFKQTWQDARAPRRELVFCRYAFAQKNKTPGKHLACRA